MIAEETCASHELSSAKNMADFSEPPLNPGGSKSDLPFILSGEDEGRDRRIVNARRRPLSLFV